MSILLTDEYLEKQIDRERERRGHKTLAATTRQLLVERLTQIDERDSLRTQASSITTATAPAA